MALTWDTPELPSPTSEAQRQDPKGTVPLVPQPACQPLGPTSSGQGISHDAPVCTNQCSLLILTCRSKNLCTHPHWTSISHSGFFLVFSGFFSQHCHFGGFSSLHNFLGNRRILRLEETLEIIQVNSFNS